MFATNGALVPQVVGSCTLPDGGAQSRACFNYYLLDRQTHEVTLISQSTGGAPGNRDVLGATMSDDGRFVLFLSYATNLGTNTLHPAQLYGLFLRDRTAGTTIGVALPNVGPTGASLQSAIISRDGNSILYSYYYSLNRPPAEMCPSPTACSLAAAAVMDRPTGSTQIVNVPRPPDIPGSVEAVRVADISPDGRFVLLYRAVSSNDSTRSGHVEFLFHDRQMATASPVSTSTWRARIRAGSSRVTWPKACPMPCSRHVLRCSIQGAVPRR